MGNDTSFSVLVAIALAAGGMPLAHAGETGAVYPSQGPSSVSESAPQNTGKDKPAPRVNDSKNLPNPKTPSSVSESAPDRTADKK